MISLIDRYIGKAFTVNFLLALVTFTSLFVSIDFMTTMNSYSNVAVPIIVDFYRYSFPSIVYQMIPVAAIIGTVFTISALNRNNELVALYSCGLSLARISLPILVVVAFISCVSYWLSDQVLPSFAQKKNFVYYVQMKNRPGLYSTVKTDRIWYRSKNVLFNIQTLNPEAKRAQGLSMYYFDNAWKLIQLVRADGVEILGREWKLKNGTVTVFAEESSFPFTKSFDEKIIHMDEDTGDLSSSTNSSEQLSVSQLNSFIKKNKEAGLDTTRYEIDLHSKFSFAFASLVMSLLGIPFSLSRVRSGGRVLNFGICIGVVFFYWTLYNSFITMGRYSYVPAMIGAWLPNLITIGVALIFLLRVKR
ncbi:MAG: LPS export ABC transporter permease LptG [Proteobacteria bacterium SG_bin7]|nr:MAG: LPS export ABC transporter permease LptG [Proteobacteria bacterium SG_bin7]